MEVEGGIGAIASRINIQGPIKRTKPLLSFLPAELMFTIVNCQKRKCFLWIRLLFYDLNTKVNYKFSDKDRIFLSGYFGRDVFTFNNTQRSRANILGETQRQPFDGTIFFIENYSPIPHSYSTITISPSMARRTT